MGGPFQTKTGARTPIKRRRNEKRVLRDPMASIKIKGGRSFVNSYGVAQLSFQKNRKGGALGLEVKRPDTENLLTAIKIELKS